MLLSFKWFGLLRLRAEQAFCMIMVLHFMAVKNQNKDSIHR